MDRIAKRRRLLAAVAAVSVALAAWGDEGETVELAGAPMRLDTREGTRPANAREVIAYSPRWSGAETCEVKVDGVTFVRATEEGMADWFPRTPGVHVLTHEAGGETLTATLEVPFGVEGETVELAGAPMRLDTREGTRIVSDREVIAYSPRWSGAETCEVKVDGVPLAQTADEGTVEWLPRTPGVHVLTHEAGGETLTATMEVVFSGPTVSYDGFEVPTRWLADHGLLGTDTPEVAVAKETGKRDGAGRKLTAGDEYLLGTDPNDADSLFRAKIAFDADGKPVISWDPALNGLNPDGSGVREGARLYRVLGKESLGAGNWRPVPEGDEGQFRFFKVTVEMP